MYFIIIGATVEVMSNESDSLLGIYFQDEDMKQMFRAYPEFLCIDATYKLLELRFPVYIMLIEDGNGQSEIIAVFLLLEETEASLSKMLEIFKKYNSAWSSVRVVMSDKDMTERQVLKASFPDADTLICLFHTLKSFRREILVEKMGITSGQRSLCLELLQQLAYAFNEEKYDEIYTQFCRSAPSTVVQYFQQQWHPIKEQWTMGMKYATGNFLNSTNNRLECINGKLKSVISRYSSLEEFVEKFFLILRVLRAERDHKAALVAQKVPVVFHSKDNASSLSYMQHLTPYAYKFVEKQIQLKEKVKLHVVDDKFYAMSSEGRIDVSTSSCECSSWHSMKLPCRHIFAARVKLEIDLFEATLCDERWSSSYYKESQRIFCGYMQDDSPSVEVVQLPAPRKKILSQVLMGICCVMHLSLYAFV